MKLLLLVAILAIAVYLTIRVIERRGVKPSRPRRPRPFGPDDDPDFLDGLGRPKGDR